MEIVPELFNYKVSILNPLTKLTVLVIFLVGTFFFYKARSKYRGELGKVVYRLFIAGVIGSLAMFIRFSGDYINYWKRGESLGYAVLGVANIYAVWPLLTFVKK
jgi:membrane-associated HD superfamily phosphohydrolase